VSNGSFPHAIPGFLNRLNDAVNFVAIWDDGFNFLFIDYLFPFPTVNPFGTFVQ
jgi:hypothetical protein